MSFNKIYRPSYSNSWALIIGINDYKAAPPLEYACNDAIEVAEVLEKKFNFSNSNITLLTNKYASRENILGNFLSLTRDEIKEVVIEGKLDILSRMTDHPMT